MERGDLKSKSFYEYHKPNGRQTLSVVYFINDVTNNVSNGLAHS